MKIALVILHADPARGGAERYTIDLAAALARIATSAVYHPVPHDCRQPWREGPRSIVGRTNGVNR